MFAKVYLYGSYSKGNAHAESDIDVAVIVPKLHIFHFSLFTFFVVPLRQEISKVKIQSPSAVSPVFWRNGGYGWSDVNNLVYYARNWIVKRVRWSVGSVSRLKVQLWAVRMSRMSKSPIP